MRFRTIDPETGAVIYGQCKAQYDYEYCGVCKKYLGKSYEIRHYTDTKWTSLHCALCGTRIRDINSSGVIVVDVF